MAFRRFEDMPQSLGALQEEMSHLLDRLWHAGLSTGPLDGQKWAPLIDLYEQAEQYVLYAEVPGVDAGSIDVSFVGRTLTIRGEKVRPAEIESAEEALRRERRYGPFCRSIDLPADMDADALTARCRGGVLEITIPKSASSRPKSVKVKAEEE